MGFAGGGTTQITAHVHSNVVGQGGNLTDATLYSHQSEINELNEISPVGTIFLWGGTKAALTDWALLCDGAAISRTDFSDLFDVIGTQFGIGDGSTTFNLPDLEDKFGRGAPSGSDSGATGGADTVTLTGPQSGIAAHTHTLAGNFAAVGTSSPDIGDIVSAAASNTGSTGPTTAASSHENRPQFQQAVYVIRF